MTKDSFEVIFDDRDLNILLDLYNFRALKTNQIKKKYFPNSVQYVNKVLYKMRKEKLIKSSILSNSRKGVKGYSYHRLTDIGMEYLARNGVNIESKASNVYTHPALLHYLFLVNDIMVRLTPAGWKMWDSRKVKKEYNLDRNMLLHGLLISPEGTKYGLYIMDQGITKNTLGKIHAEIRVHSPILNNYLIFSKGQDSYNDFLNMAVNTSYKRVNNRYIKQPPLVTSNELKLLPSGFGTTLYKFYPDKNEWVKVLAKWIGFELIDNHTPSKRISFQTTIRYNGEEMYLVDLIKTDITEMNRLRKYSANDYQWEKKRILVISFLEVHEELININETFIMHIRLKTADLESFVKAEIKNKYGQ